MTLQPLRRYVRSPDVTAPQQSETSRDLQSRQTSWNIATDAAGQRRTLHSHGAHDKNYSLDTYGHVGVTKIR